MLVIDGSRGEGGGQILRTALALAMVTGTTLQIERIRARRAKPGLMPQHLVCVRAAQAVCGAEVAGVELGSSWLRFRPGPIRAGHYHFAIGTAGSTTLVFQTLLPALLLADVPSTVELEGGTHNAMAPSVDFIRLAFLPALRRMGIEVEMTLLRHGFYPVGGGLWRASVQPWRDKRPLCLLEPGDCLRREAVAISARLPEHVAQRELAQVRALLGWSEQESHSQAVSSPGPGNVLSLRLYCREQILVSECVGHKGLPAEEVARRAVAELRRLHAAGVPVDAHLADQLLVFLALGAGGEFRTLAPTRHTLTNLDVIRGLSGATFNLCEEQPGIWSIRRSAAMNDR